MNEDVILQGLQQKTLETLKYTIDFFERHNLRYVACGGTCLGAVRHKDMIPWDDDVDLFMPYEDYKKLLSLKAEIDATKKYVLYTPETSGFYDPISRISCTDVTIWRNYINRFVFGTQIDIFPIYNTDESDEQIASNQKRFFELTNRFQRANQNYRFVDFWECITHRHLRGLIRTTKWALSTKNREKYLQEYRDFEAKLHNPDGKKCTIYGACAYGVEIYKAGYFDEYETVPFHDFTIRIPKVYDAYLKYLYHDYMQLPPEDKRHANHLGNYVNLKEGLTIDEVRQRMKNGEFYVM